MPRGPKSGDLVLVTGATGRIGANLCRVLRDRGFRIRGVALPGDPAIAKLAGLDAEISSCPASFHGAHRRFGSASQDGLLFRPMRRLRSSFRGWRFGC